MLNRNRGARLTVAVQRSSGMAIRTVVSSERRCREKARPHRHIHICIRATSGEHPTALCTLLGLVCIYVHKAVFEPASLPQRARLGSNTITSGIAIPWMSAAHWRRNEEIGQAVPSLAAICQKRLVVYALRNYDPYIEQAELLELVQALLLSKGSGVEMETYDDLVTRQLREEFWRMSDAKVKVMEKCCCRQCAPWAWRCAWLRRSTPY